MQVFVSHSRQNGSAALKLCERLTPRGVKTWLDLRELDSGANWQERVADVIGSADAFIFLVGPEGPSDQWQRFEWQQVTAHEYYLDPEKPLIPIIIGETTEVPGFLKTRQALRVSAESVDFDALADKVLRVLQDPGTTVDPEKLEIGREARRQALASLKAYADDLELAEAKQAGLRALK